MRRLVRPAAAPRHLRRPAAAIPGGAAPGPKRRLRRPAGAAEGEEEVEEVGRELSTEEVAEKFKRGEVVEGVRLTPGAIERGDVIVAHQGRYYQQKAPFALKVEKEELDGGEQELCGVLTGTESEALLRHATTVKPCRVQVHLCKKDCPQLRENPNLLHTKTLQKLLPATPKTWENNLIEEVETGALQAEAEEWRKREEAREPKEKRRSSSTSRSVKKKKKKRKKKKKEKEERGEPAAPDQMRLGGKTVAKKPLEQIYRGTGLDPSWKRRKKLMRKVKKSLKRNKDSSSSTGSSSSSTSSGMEGENLLEDRSRIHRIATLAPGVLSAQGISNMKEHLTQVAGSGWEADNQQLPPLLCLYHRTYMMGKLSGGVSREFCTLSWIGDLLLQGRVAEGMDALMQRLKSLEMTAGGSNWATSQKLELVPPPTAAIGSRAEYQVARKEAKLDQQLLPPAQAGEKGKSKGKEKGREKGKDKGKGKGKEGEGKKAA